VETTHDEVCVAELLHVFAEGNTPETCSATSLEVQKYVDEFAQEVLDTLANVTVHTDGVVHCRAGLYQEPLERVMEYLGLATKTDDQWVGGAMNEALDHGIPHALLSARLSNAVLWYRRYRRMTRNRERARFGGWTVNEAEAAQASMEAERVAAWATEQMRAADFYIAAENEVILPDHLTEAHWYENASASDRVITLNY
jgi:hypothetical protein